MPDHFGYGHFGDIVIDSHGAEFHCLRLSRIRKRFAWSELGAFGASQSPFETAVPQGGKR